MGLSSGRLEQVAPDTSVVIVRVNNQQQNDVTVFLDSQDGRRRIGLVTPMHESLFVLPSAALAAVTEFVVTVIPEGLQVRPYQTDYMTRTPGKMMYVFIEVVPDEAVKGALSETVIASQPRRSDLVG